MKELLPDVLAERYASTPLVNLWSRKHRIRTERALWVADLKARQHCGLDIPDEVIHAYEASIDIVDLPRIDQLEIERRSLQRSRRTPTHSSRMDVP